MSPMRPWKCVWILIFVCHCMVLCHSQQCDKVLDPTVDFILRRFVGEKNPEFRLPDYEDSNLVMQRAHLTGLDTISRSCSLQIVPTEVPINGSSNQLATQLNASICLTGREFLFSAALKFKLMFGLKLPDVVVVSIGGLTVNLRGHLVLAAGSSPVLQQLKFGKLDYFKLTGASLLGALDPFVNWLMKGKTQRWVLNAIEKAATKAISQKLAEIKL